MKSLSTKKLIAIVLLPILLFIIIFSNKIIAQLNQSGFNLRLNSKAETYMDKIQSLITDSSQIIKYHYSMDYYIDDTTNQQYTGVTYQGTHIKVDSNLAQFSFNNTKEFLAVNFKTQQAIYSNLEAIRQQSKNTNATKGENNDHINKSDLDSLKQIANKYANYLMSDSMKSKLILKDNSYENEQQIVIDVLFNEACQIQSYRLYFNKSTVMPDSSIIVMKQMTDLLLADNLTSEQEETTPEQDYLEQSNEQVCTITFKAYGFQKGNYELDYLLNQFIRKSKDNVVMLNKKYSLTNLKY